MDRINGNKQSLVISTLFLFLLSFVSRAHAGSNYVMAPTFGTMDSTNNCAASGTVNCWTLLPGSVREVSIGADGIVYALNSANTVYTMAPTKNVAANWTQSTLPAILHIAVQDVNNVYALGANSFCPNSRAVYKANSSLNGWTAISPLGCGWSINVAEDGTLGVIGEHQDAYILKPGSTGWMRITGSGYTGTMAVQNAHTAYVLKGQIMYKANLDNNTVTTARTGFQSSISIDASGIMWLMGANNGAANGNTYSYDTNTGQLIAYRGFLDQVVTGPNMDFTFGIQNATGNVYHFRHTFAGATVNVRGYYDCSSLINGCPVGSSHVAKSTIAFVAGGLHGTAGVTGSDSGAPSTQLNSVATEWAGGCDLIFGNPTAPECQIRDASGQVLCSVMGQIYDGALTGLIRDFVEVAFTRAKATGFNGANCVQHSLGVTCDWPTQNWCTAATTPPDKNVLIVRDWRLNSLLQNPTFWNTLSICTRQIGPGHPWNCGSTIGYSYTSQNQPLFACTHNP